MHFSGLLKPLTALVAIATFVSASPVVLEQREATNAERMASGMAPMKPKRLFDPSRTRALRPRVSGSIDTDQYVATGPASGTSGRKRNTGLGFFTVNEGVLQYTTTQADASAFRWANYAESELAWVATEDTPSAGIVTGTTYDMYAVLSGNIYQVMVGPVPDNAITNIFSTARYNGDLNPYLPPAGSSISQQFIWVMDTSGNMLLAPDYATATTAIPGAQVMLTQTFTLGQPASLAAASAAQETSLVNPVKLYARDALGKIYGYISIGSSGGLWLQLDSGTAATFYVPGLGNAALAQQVYTVKSSTTLTVVGTSSGAGAQSLSLSDASTATGVVEFAIPTSESGIITLSSSGSSYSLYYSSSSGILLACYNAPDCTAAKSDSQELCLEVVPSGTTPSACAAWANQQFATNYVDGSALYVYDPYGTYSGYWQYTGTSLTSSIGLTSSQANATYVYLDATSAGQAVQELYADVNSFVWSFQAYPEGTGTSNIQASVLNDIAPAGTSFNIPSDPSTGGIITLSPSTYVSSSPTTTTWPFYVSDAYGFASFYACQSASECTASHSGAYEVCVEMVPIGGEPSACAATYVPPTVPTYPQCTTQLDTGGITYARMTLYDSEANELEGGSSFMTEETCVAGCNAVNAATPNTCTGVFWFNDAVKDSLGLPCNFRGKGSTWQKDWIASSPGAEMVLIGTCNDWASNVPSDMLATCCENPAA